MTRTILRSTRRKPNPTGDGYDRRSLQLAELVKAAEFEIADIQKLAKNRITKYINGFFFLCKHRFQLYPLYKLYYSIDFLHLYRAIRICGEEVENYKNTFNQYKGIKLLLWEATEKQIPHYLAHKAGFKLVVAPHNFESLVVDLNNPYAINPIINRLKIEIEQLAKADAIFCISREEQWLLNQFGIKANFLPYYPPKQILSEFLAIREVRKNSHQNRFLILGTAKNPPTFLGMKKQIKYLQKIKQTFDFELDIAGYGTEKLQPYCENLNFKLHGTVDSQKLNQLLTSAKAVLIYQESGVGALTKIPEMLISGIPVIANSHACRSALAYSGVYSYENNDELAKLMIQKLDMPEIPSRPTDAERRFINCLKNLSV